MAYNTVTQNRQKKYHNVNARAIPRARVNIKQASVQTPGSSVFVVWNARGFDFWRMNRRTYSTIRYTLIQQSSFRILYETRMLAINVSIPNLAVARL